MTRIFGKKSTGLVDALGNLDKNIGWGIFGLFRNLSYTEICDHLRNLAENAQNRGPIANSATPILQQYDSGNPDNGLERLKWWHYDDDDRALIYIRQ